MNRFLQPAEEGGVDELYLVYTEFQSMVKQEPVAHRMLPLAVRESEGAEAHPLYEFEPSAEEVLDACCRATSSHASSPPCSRPLPPSWRHASGP